MTANSWLIVLVAFLLGFLLCWLLVSFMGMGHRAIRMMRERYKTLDENFADLEKSFQAKDETDRTERRALLDKLAVKDEVIQTLTSDKDELIVASHNASQAHKLEIGDLNADLSGKADENSQMVAEIQRLETEVSRLETEIEMAKSRGSVAQSSDSEMKMLQHSMKRLKDMMEEEGTAYRQQITDLQERLEAALSNKTQKDDLTQIKGVGPKIESILNDHKIFNFKDLVEASNLQLAKVRKDLGGLADRIERDDWVGQAKKHLS